MNNTDFAKHLQSYIDSQFNNKPLFVSYDNLLMNPDESFTNMMREIDLLYHIPFIKYDYDIKNTTYLNILKNLQKINPHHTFILLNNINDFLTFIRVEFTSLKNQQVNMELNTFINTIIKIQKRFNIQCIIPIPEKNIPLLKPFNNISLHHISL